MSLLTDFQSFANVMKSALSKKADKSELTPAGDITSSSSQGYAVAKDVYSGLSGKQNTLTAGTGISISNDTISATGGLPSGTNNGDILVWNGSAWVSKPKWQMIYQPVEYIESTGTQRIQTGVYASPTIRVVADMQYTKTPTEVNASMLNGATNGTWGFIWGWDQAIDKFQTLVNNSYNWAVATQGDTNRHTWDLASGSQKIDDVEYSTTSMTSTPSTSYDITLFVRYSNGNFNTPCYVKYYSCKIYDGNTLIRDFVPAYNVYTGETGCYEMVQQKFYANNGSGNFVLGPEV